MTMDSFTTSVVFSAASINGGAGYSDALHSLVKSLEGNKPVSSEVVEFVEANVGRGVRVLGTCYEGIIYSCNKAESGFYPGSRFPVFVKITKSSDPLFDTSIDTVFEYSLDQIELI